VTAIAYAITGVAVFVALVMLHIHVVLGRSAPVSHVVALWLIVGAVLIILVPFLEPEHRLGLTVANAAVYLFGGEVCLFIYAVAVGSLSVRILVAMFELGTHDAFERTMAQSSPEAFFDGRLRGLVDQRLLSESCDTFRVTRKGRRWTFAALSLKRILAVGAGG
jgi:hypothetical protein